MKLFLNLAVIALFATTQCLAQCTDFENVFCSTFCKYKSTGGAGTCMIHVQLRAKAYPSASSDKYHTVTLDYDDSQHVITCQCEATTTELDTNCGPPRLHHPASPLGDMPLPNPIPMPDKGTGSLELERYYYDYSVHKCLVFSYGGQGGDGNNYKTRQDCENKCVNSMVDYIPCQGTGHPCKSGPLLNDQGDGDCPRGESCNLFNTPPDFDGSRNGQCCQETYDDYMQAQEGDCRPSSRFGQGDGERIGRSCDLMPCAGPEQCQQVNDNFAICCPEKMY